MKLVYNLGSINHARDALRIDHRSYKQKSYTSSKKMQIVQAVDRLLAVGLLGTTASRCAKNQGTPDNQHIVGIVLKIGR
jgi:hypothetical protein